MQLGNKPNNLEGCDYEIPKAPTKRRSFPLDHTWRLVNMKIAMVLPTTTNPNSLTPHELKPQYMQA